eukprot:Gb_09268 [translate_table: standard]
MVCLSMPTFYNSSIAASSNGVQRMSQSDSSMRPKGESVKELHRTDAEEDSRATYEDAKEKDGSRVLNKEKKKEELPWETSPYVNYSDLDDYKRRGYGADGHVDLTPPRGGAVGTDGPTLAGAALKGDMSQVDDLGRPIS